MSQQLSASDLAAKLNVSKARVSQYVSQGKLDGCFVGEGRSRRFDLAKVMVALGKSLDKGQMLGNGAATRQAMLTLAAQDDEEEEGAGDQDNAAPKESAPLQARDPDRYELARILKAEEEGRRLRRQNNADEGQWVLASEVERETMRQIAQELAEFDTVIREGARAVADQLGVDFKMVRKILLDRFRQHREDRARAKAGDAAGADLSDPEKSADF